MFNEQPLLAQRTFRRFSGRTIWKGRVSYALWAFSVPLAMSILVVLLLASCCTKLPESDMAASGWLALGPIGTGALALLLLGGDARLRCCRMSGIGEIALGLGIIGGTVLWGFGL
jgi:hypothetical protein